LLAAAPAWGQAEEELKERVKQLEEKIEQFSGQMEQSELEKLVLEAETEAKAPEEEIRPEEREFLWGALALQKLNPEISISGDIVAGLVIEGTKFYGGDGDRGGMPLREVSITVQHVLDPYSTFKGAINFTPWPNEAASVEEFYITWFGIVPSLSFTVGRFRHNFGVINRWHEHDLDQVNYPLAMNLVLGEDGLGQTGASIKWFMPPLWAHANELTLEIADGENDTLFAGEFFTVPTAMLHLKSYYDLSESTYLELGLTGMFGFNNRRGYLPDGATELEDEDWRKTIAAGANLTIYWSPPQQAKYRSLTWRSEFYYVNKEMPVGGPDEVQHSWGFYSYVDYQLATRWFCGVRYDLALPTIRDNDDLAWDVVPYITFWQSEFVYLRLEYSHGEKIPYIQPDGTLARQADNRILFQIDFAAGPHKHEKY
jgi:hypothetical protein